MIKKISKELTAYISAALIVWCCILLIKHEGCIHNQITESIQRCLNVIIPSMFAFMAFSSIIINSRIYTYISKPFYPISKYIFAMPNELFFVFIMGNISGYPIGAKLLTQLVEENKISKRSAAVLNCFCYNGGPAFYSGAIGMTVFGSSNIGIIVFISTVTANAIIAVILNRLCKHEYTDQKQGLELNSDTIVNAVMSSGKSMFTVCITIIFFSVITSMLDINGFFDLFKSAGLSDSQCTLIKTIFEISNLSELKDNDLSSLPFICALCSFGGICVLMQIKSIVKNTYSLKYFIGVRLLSMPLSGMVCWIIMKFYSPEIIPAAAVSSQIVAQPDNIIPSACLAAMIIILFMHKKAARV